MYDLDFFLPFYITKVRKDTCSHICGYLLKLKKKNVSPVIQQSVLNAIKQYRHRETMWHEISQLLKHNLDFEIRFPCFISITFATILSTIHLWNDNSMVKIKSSDRLNLYKE